MELHDRVRYIRKNILHLTQTQFATELKTTRSVINNLEQGSLKRTDQKRSFLMLICEKYGVSPKWLIDGIGEPSDAVENENAAYVEALIGESDNAFCEMIRAIMKIYIGCDESSKKVIREFAEKLKKEMR